MLTRETTTGSRTVVAPFAVIRNDLDCRCGNRLPPAVVEYDIVNVARVVQATGDGAESVQIHLRSEGSDIIVLSEENFAAIAAAQRSFARNATAAQDREALDVAWGLVDDQRTWVDRVWHTPEADPIDDDYFQAHAMDVVDVSYGESLWEAWL